MTLASTHRHFSLGVQRLSSFFGLLVLIIGAASILALLVWKIPKWERAVGHIADIKDRISLENEILKNLIQTLGGALLLAGLYFTWKNLTLAREGQITDRFNQAVEHLGSEKLEIRLGGIYALARIAKDSSADHWPVMQILCAYVREKTKGQCPEYLTLPTDVQAILTVLGERTLDYEMQQQTLDLSTAYLPGADLRGACFERARFDNAKLERVNFLKARLSGANFSGADMTEAHLREAQLNGANLIAANLQDASLRDANLRGASLFGARLRGAVLIGADMTGALYATEEQIASAILDSSTRQPECSKVPLEDPGRI